VPAAVEASEEPQALSFDIEPEAAPDALDFSPSGTLVVGSPMMEEKPEPLAVEVADDAAMLDFGLSQPAMASAEPDVSGNELAVDAADDDFSFDLGVEPALDATPAAVVPEFDLSSINLDLTADVGATPAAAPVAAAADVSEAVSEVAEAAGDSSFDAALREEVSTKLDLAKAYEEMGDLEGARELLGEVAAEGPPDLAAEAKEIMARIA
jgi:pilus assembly protein FimV